MGLMALIIVPFLIWGDQFTQFTESRLAAPPSTLVAVALCIALLAADVVLPIPSSFVSTAAGYLLGFWGGLLASTAGLTLGCAIGYWMGARLGEPVANKMINPSDFVVISGRLKSKPFVWLVLMRPVPVLAEASCIIAGIVRVPIAGYTLWTLVANMAVSVIYAAAGSKAVSTLWAFAVAMALPGAGMLIARLTRKDRSTQIVP
ncbi:MAG: hypothetical protein JWN34_3867 [Bryobacterales bacterium]|nr:hypothetical protein [Bryobacterales bacterium]